MKTLTVRVYDENEKLLGMVPVEIYKGMELIIGTSPIPGEGELAYPEDISTKASFGPDCLPSEAPPYEASVPILVRNPGEAPKLP